jgi:2-amino-4-hydroxy-6-hydroxymethyldihydropteridine diphosphokinase
MPEHVVYIGVGSNIAPETNIVSALERLKSHATITGVSAFYRTPALLRPEQPPYLNGVIRVRTALDVRPLKFEVLRGIETALGRIRSDDAYAARPIDLDILLFDALAIDEDGMRIPDPDIGDRVFLAAGLLELDPGLMLPGTGERVGELACLAQAERLVCMESFTAHLRQTVTP